MDTVLQKSGPELFKELYRLYPLSEVEDYFGNGIWQDAIMREHYKLIFQHREEAGSPDLPPLNEIKFPDIPKGTASSALKLGVGFQPGLSGPAAPMLGGTGTQMAQLMAAALKMTQGGAQAVPPQSGGNGGPANPQAAVAELKNIMTFVAKHKLDFKSVSSVIMGAPLAVRQAVMLEFAPKEGSDTIQELKNFIAEKNATTPAALEPAGIKRPAPAVLAGAVAQRPRLMMPGAGVAKAPMVPGLVTTK